MIFLRIYVLYNSQVANQIRIGSKFGSIRFVRSSICDEIINLHFCHSMWVARFDGLHQAHPTSDTAYVSHRDNHDHKNSSTPSILTSLYSQQSSDYWLFYTSSVLIRPSHIECEQVVTQSSQERVSSSLNGPWCWKWGPDTSGLPAASERTPIIPEWCKMGLAQGRDSPDLHDRG